MDVVRSLPLSIVGSILIMSLVSGPLVGVGGPPSASYGGFPGDGDADIEVISVPEEGALTPVPYASSGYVLSLPSATVDVSNLSGRPMVVYKLRISELWYVAGTTHVLDEDFTGRQKLTLDEPVLNSTTIEREAYHAELRIIKRAHEVDTVLYRGNLTLQVDR
jgi:hypothetical protein